MNGVLILSFVQLSVFGIDFILLMFHKRSNAFKLTKKNQFMKTSFFYFLMLLCLSCSEVRFETPQPQDSQDLLFFPDALIGQYDGGHDDTLTITRNSLQYADNSKQLLTSDKVCLRKKRSTYFLSTKEILVDVGYSNHWEVFPLDLKDDTLMIRFFSVYDHIKGEHFLLELKKLLEVNEVLGADGNVEYYLVDPTIAQFDTIATNPFYTGVEKFVKIN